MTAPQVGSGARAWIAARGPAPLIMGVVNVTPDSFSDGGRHASADSAIAHGIALWQQGAHILDIGGEATNPRAQGVGAEEELRRVLPVIRALARSTEACISVDTTKARVAAEAVAAGAHMINDISGGRYDPGIWQVVARGEVAYISGHLRGHDLAQTFAHEGEVTWQEVADEQLELLGRMPATAAARTLLDPGLGLGKGAGPSNLELLRHLEDLELRSGCPVVVGPSRKRFLRRLLPDGCTELELDGASVAACLAAARRGAAVLRIHNVALLRSALTVYTQI
jgi:dihydropteroate synthase